MSSKALSLMTGMLNMEVSSRLTAIECLAHPYFDGMRSEETDNLIQGYNQLKQQQLNSAAFIYNQNSSS